MNAEGVRLKKCRNRYLQGRVPQSTIFSIRSLCRDVRQIEDEVNVIIQNAWNVNLDQFLESFEDHFHGVRNFIDWSTTSTQYPRAMFVSSVSLIANWAACYPEDKLIPEESLTDVDYNIVLPMGYGELKQVTERMLAVAAERSDIKADILCLGQVAGPVAHDGGCQDKIEWSPILIQTSKSLVYIPDALVGVDWIPADVLAHAIRDLAIMTMQKMIGGKVASLKEWTEKSRKANGNDTKEVAAKQALKILDWFNDVAAATSSDQESLKQNDGGTRSSESSVDGALVGAVEYLTGLRESDSIPR